MTVAEPDLLDQVILGSEPHLCCCHLIPVIVSIVFQTAGFGYILLGKDCVEWVCMCVWGGGNQSFGNWPEGMKV